tara:strand:+ start:392 stop:793 length:402 start_codon:yes stop_codon:yes gene_type:complete
MQSVDEKGVEKTKNILKQGLEQGYENQDLLIAFIIKCVCKSFKISESELFLGRSRKDGKRTGARAMLVYMLYKHIDFSQSQISKMFNLNKATTSRDIKYMESLNPKFTQEKKQLEKKTKINNDIVLFVENNNI